jgi:hypothetical protein
MASHDVIAAIEAELQRQRPGRWRRLIVEELNQGALRLFQSGWRVEISQNEIRPTEVDHFLVVIDAVFPNSQPRILAPGMGSDFRWPHVEPQGFLCLRPTSVAASAADRVRIHLGDALELLNYTEEKCATEFEREFGAYWSHQAIRPDGSLRVVSLVKPGGKSRQIFFHLDSRLSDWWSRTPKRRSRRGSTAPGHRSVIILSCRVCSFDSKSLGCPLSFRKPLAML